MAVIRKLGVPRDDLESIAVFMRSDSDADVPELTGLSAKVLDRITVPAAGLSRIAVGNFVEYKRRGERDFVDPQGNSAKYADAYFGEDGNPTGKWGKVVEDYENPTDAFEISVPL